MGFSVEYIRDVTDIFSPRTQLSTAYAEFNMRINLKNPLYHFVFPSKLQLSQTTHKSAYHGDLFVVLSMSYHYAISYPIIHTL